MKSASVTYKMLRALDTSKHEWRVLQSDKTYELDKLRSISVSYSLTTEDGIDIGNANSAKCQLTLVEESANWQRMAKFTVQFRICSAAGGTYSEWITLGKFYTDQRSEDKFGNLTIIGYDAMLKLETTWADKIPSASLPSVWPITAKAWATMIDTAGLADFEDLTQLNDTVAFVGLNTASTIRDVLKDIAVVHAGNWMVTTTETLNLVQFENVDPEETSTYFDLQMATQSLDDSPALPAVTGAHLETEMGAVTESGTDTGYMVKAICDVSTTTGISELCLSRITGYVFRPFFAGTAYLDPRADIGDSVKINGTIYQIMTIDWTLGKSTSADVSAPYDQEIDHEYTIPNPETKTYRKAMSLVDEKMDDYVAWSEFSTAIEQNEQQISLIAESTCVTQVEFDAEIASLQDQIDGNVQSWSGNAVPTLNNSPASSWTTAADKAEHVGDIYFVNSDAGIPEAGNYYRFEVDNGVYSWQILSDSVLTEALSKAAAALAAAEAAEDTADASLAEAQLKGRIFVVQPTPPYDVGDLWFNSTDSVIKVCMTAKTSGQSFADSDWVKRDKYTDDSSFNTWLSTTYASTIAAIQDQVDHKAETYYQSADPAIEWGGCIAGIAIAGLDVIGVPETLQHTGDLWYRTTDKTTWYWNGSAWVQQDVPQEVFDQIDGKARIFVSIPETYDEYDIGDLWVNATIGNYSNDVLRSIAHKDAGEYFDINHWIKASKYTDDTALVQFQSEFTVQPNQIRAEVEKRVIKDQSSTMSTFGWVMNETSHTWYSNADEVMKVNASGLTVKGQIKATSGYIGSEQNGFTITASAIRNGMTSLSDTSHNGVYVGTDGIALGQGKFKVTSAGVITAKSGTIGGFTITASSIYNGVTSFSDESHDGVYIGTDGIALGKGRFKVSSDGSLAAADGWFTGSVIAKQVLSDYDYPGYNFGTYNGQGLTEYSVYGGSGGQLGYAGNGGIIGANLEYSTVETAQVSSGINTSLGYANFANGVFNATNTAGYVKTAAIIDSAGRTFYSSTLAYKNHQGTNMYARLWISTDDW